MINQNKRSVKASRITLMRVTALVVAIALLCAGTAFAATSETYVVHIYEGSQITRAETWNGDPYAVVKDAGIQLSDGDKLILDNFSAGTDSRIVICRLSNVVLIDADGNANNIVFAGTVNELFAEQGIVLGDDFVSNVDVNAVVTDNMEIRITHSYGITINVDGETKTVKSTAKTVGDFLAEQGITLDGDDEVVPTAETELSEGLFVEVLRVEYVTRNEVESIPFESKTTYNSSMKKGTSKVTCKGVNGSKTVVYEDRIVNGEVESSTAVSETVTKEPVTKVTTVGTNTSGTITAGGNKKIEKNGAPISEIQLPSKYSVNNNVPTSYKSTIKGKAAAYCVPGGTTATGKAVKPGYIAVNPKQIPYGTEMWIVSDDGVVYGYCIAADTGGFAKNGTYTVDLYMSSTQQCYAWGSRNVTIYIL